MVEGKTLAPNFGRLALGCVDADFCERILILENILRSTVVRISEVGVPTFAPQFANRFDKN